jgi:hypothetical protein
MPPRLTGGALSVASRSLTAVQISSYPDGRMVRCLGIGAWLASDVAALRRAAVQRRRGSLPMGKSG